MYDLFECESFGAQMATLSGHEQDLIIKTVMEKLPDNPTNTHPPINSKKLHDDLECIRRIHATNDLVIFYSVCQECKKNPFCIVKIGCEDCQSFGAFTVILIACGHWEYLYKELQPTQVFAWLKKVKVTYESPV